MPAHGLKPSKAGKSDQVGADGLLLESPNTYLNSNRYFRLVVLGHYVTSSLFLALIHFSNYTMYYFLMFRLVSVLTL